MKGKINSRMDQTIISIAEVGQKKKLIRESKAVFSLQEVPFVLSSILCVCVCSTIVTIQLRIYKNVKKKIIYITAQRSDICRRFIKKSKNMNGKKWNGQIVHISCMEEQSWAMLHSEETKWLLLYISIFIFVFFSLFFCSFRLYFMMNA